MRFGITGNTNKENIWAPIAEIIQRLVAAEREFCIQQRVSDGLKEQGVVDESVLSEKSTSDIAGDADIVLSFGGDGTLLNTAHEIGDRGTPILGVNLGRLGFMTHVEVATLDEAITRLENGKYEVEERLALSATISDGSELPVNWALNEFAFQRSGEAGLLSIDVHVDGKPLNTFWADGLIIATPTGSTAYSLALGGPIMSPGCGGILITPVAPHTLTVRPIVIPDTSIIEVRILDTDKDHVFTSDGMSTILKGNTSGLIIKRAAHSVRLVKFDDQEYFDTLRSKLMWGVRKS
ncbi:MAG: NAD(+)/NADH kinase [Rhodothermia bacterium]|nr:MAG: NAD(+)/NADH kinase [Rhodothermia bacterium]